MQFDLGTLELLPSLLNSNYNCIPQDQTCPSLRRLYGHMRHPSFLALTLILWIHPLMTLDRFLLSFCLTGYMYLAWRPDLQDHTYQCTMWKNKTKILEASKF